MLFPMMDYVYQTVPTLEAWIDGAIVSANAPALPLLDQAYLSGMGVFETIRVDAGVPLFFDAHHARLVDAADIFHLSVPGVDTLRDAIRRLMSRQGWLSARVRLTVSGSIPPNGKPLQLGGRARTTVLAFPLVKSRASAVRMITTPHRIDAAHPLAGRKCTSYAMHALAAHYARAHEGDEAMMLNQHDEVAGGAISNIFWVMNGRVFTPDTRCGCRPGVTRGRVMEACAALGIACEATRAEPRAVLAAEEMFTTSSICGVRSVVSLDGTPYRAGPLAKRIRAALLREEKRAIQAGY